MDHRSRLLEFSDWLTVGHHRMAIMESALNHRVVVRGGIHTTAAQFKGIITGYMHGLISGIPMRSKVFFEIWEDDNVVDFANVVLDVLGQAGRYDLVDLVRFSRYGLNWYKNWEADIICVPSHEAHATTYGNQFTVRSSTYRTMEQQLDEMMPEFIAMRDRGQSAAIWIEVDHISLLDDLKHVVARALVKHNVRRLTCSVKFYQICETDCSSQPVKFASYADFARHARRTSGSQWKSLCSDIINIRDIHGSFQNNIQCALQTLQQRVLDKPSCKHIAWIGVPNWCPDISTVITLIRSEINADDYTGLEGRIRYYTIG